MGLQLLNMFALFAQTLLTKWDWLPAWAGIMPAFNSNAGIVLTLLTFIGIITLAGLWLHHQWAWYTTMIQVGANLFTLLYLYFNDIPQYAGMVINVVIVFYLNRVTIRYKIFHEDNEATTP